MNKVGLKIVLFLFAVSSFIAKAQNHSPIDSLAGFDQKEFASWQLAILDRTGNYQLEKFIR